MNGYICDNLSKSITVFQNAIERNKLCWKNGKKALDKGENVCTIFMDLSKVFDTINHDLA